MPYVKKEIRDRIDFHHNPQTAGDLNYYFSNIIKDYLTRKGESYQIFNDIIGALECCKQELYRRKIAPYEDIKINENGDVY